MLTSLADVMIRRARAERPREPREETCALRRHFVLVGIW